MGKRILFLTSGSPEGWSEHFLSSIVSAATVRENNVMLVVFGDGDDLPESISPDIKFTIIERAGMLDVKALLVLRRIFQQHHPDVVFCVDHTAFAWARVANIGVLHAARYLVSWPGSDRRNPLVRVWRRLLTSLMRPSDEMIMTTRLQMEALADQPPVRHGRVRLIYNGVDDRHWAPAPKGFDARQIRSRLRIPEQAKLIVMNAPFVPEHHHTAAVAALKVLCLDLQTDAHLVFLGTGIENGRIRLAAMHSGVKERIHFVPYPRDVREWYWSANLITHTGRQAESLPHATVEAICCGIPAVVTDACGAAEIITEGINGFVTSINPSDIAVKWHKALRHQFSSRNIHRMMKQRFNLNRMRKEYQQALGVN